MRVSTAAELGIRGMVYLARNYQNGPVPMGMICRDQRLPRQYMLKIFSALNRAGFVRTCRGKGGGFTLAQPPGSISLLDIVEAVEGPLALNLCQNEPSQCRWAETDCSVKPVWNELQEFARQKLGAFKLDRVTIPDA